MGVVNGVVMGVMVVPLPALLSRVEAVVPEETIAREYLARDRNSLMGVKT
jgi:hypothetical protein